MPQPSEPRASHRRLPEQLSGWELRVSCLEASAWLSATPEDALPCSKEEYLATALDHYYLTAVVQTTNVLLFVVRGGVSLVDFGPFPLRTPLYLLILLPAALTKPSVCLSVVRRLIFFTEFRSLSLRTPLYSTLSTSGLKQFARGKTVWRKTWERTM